MPDFPEQDNRAGISEGVGLPKDGNLDDYYALLNADPDEVEIWIPKDPTIGRFSRRSLVLGGLLFTSAATLSIALLPKAIEYFTKIKPEADREQQIEDLITRLTDQNGYALTLESVAKPDDPNPWHNLERLTLLYNIVRALPDDFTKPGLDGTKEEMIVGFFNQTQSEYGDLQYHRIILVQENTFLLKNATNALSTFTSDAVMLALERKGIQGSTVESADERVRAWENRLVEVVKGKVYERVEGVSEAMTAKDATFSDAIGLIRDRCYRFINQKASEYGPAKTPNQQLIIDTAGQLESLITYYLSGDLASPEFLGFLGTLYVSGRFKELIGQIFEPEFTDALYGFYKDFFSGVEYSAPFKRKTS